MRIEIVTLIGRVGWMIANLDYREIITRRNSITSRRALAYKEIYVLGTNLIHILPLWEGQPYHALS